MRLRLHARRAWRTGVIIAVGILGGLAAAMFARFCDLAMHANRWIHDRSPLVTLALLPIGFVTATWLTRRFAPEAAGSGIPQVIAAAEQRWTGRWGGQRVTLRTAAWKVVLTAWLLVCGASIGREGPTVQVVAGLIRTLTRGLRGGPGRRALIIAGGAAGVSAAFNTPVAGVVFALEELARGFERRTHTAVILIVVLAGLASYALQGDYAYFGALTSATPALGSAWLAAPLIGVVAGLAGGLFSRALAATIGPGDNPVIRWRRARPIVFALLCGLVAAFVAWVSGGITYGAGYDEAKSLLQDHPGRGFGFAVAKFVASLAASMSGAPGGIFAPSLATGAGIGAAFARLGLSFGGRDAVVLGMGSYLSGVVQAPLTSAVILMEMTRDPSLVGPLLLGALTARWISGLVMPEPLYHVLSRSWRLSPGH
jgi:H+/Cl- antiporter ClcA